MGAPRPVRGVVSPGGFGPLFFECSGEHWNKGGGTVMGIWIMVALLGGVWLLLSD